MQAASKVKMSGSEKKKRKQEQRKQNLWLAHTTIPPLK